MASTVLFMVAELGVIFLGFGGLLLVSALIHEVGHVVGGLLCGFGIEGVRVGPIELRRKEGWVWEFSRSDLVGGIVLGQFRRPPGPLAALQCFGFFIAGPLANVLVSLILARLSSSPTIAGAFAGWLAIVSLFVGVLNLIPFKTKHGRSDGAKLLWLVFSKKRREGLIFIFGMKARIEKFKALLRNQHLQEAIDSLDELIAGLLDAPNLKAEEAIQKFAKARDAIAKALAEAGNSNPGVLMTGS
jgi:hypothetical protein